MRAYPGPASEDVINWLLEISDMFSQWQEDLKVDNDLAKIKFSLLKLPDLETA
jgi:two-component system chemotaxis sensor kinase CheA